MFCGSGTTLEVPWVLFKSRSVLEKVFACNLPDAFPIHQAFPSYIGFLKIHSTPDTIKLLEENTGRTLFDINHSKIFFDPPPRVMEIKTQINKWDLVKLKSFFTAKETINKTKRQPSEWEKIFANESTGKGLISKIYKQLMQLNIKKKTTQSKNGQKI